MVSDDWFAMFVGCLDDGNESVVLVGVVFHCASPAISFLQTVGSFHFVAIPRFPLLLHITFMWVVDCVVKFIFWVCLKITYMESVL